MRHKLSKPYQKAGDIKHSYKIKSQNDIEVNKYVNRSKYGTQHILLLLLPTEDHTFLPNQKLTNYRYATGCDYVSAGTLLAKDF